MKPQPCFASVAILPLVVLLTGPSAAPPPRGISFPGVKLARMEGRPVVIVEATVVLVKGPLEGLVTRAKKKEHEYVLAADVDARHLHLALLLAGAVNGSPVKFAPKYTAPHGTKIRIQVRYRKGKKVVTEPASEWVRDAKTRKPLPHDWVFAGSYFGPNPEREDGPPYYMANHGDLICLCNIETALLDLPFRSPKAYRERYYEANTEKIPPVGTRVEVILDPMPTRKK